jgi:hypothetical protein
MLNRTNRILAVVLVLVIALALSSRVDYSRPNFEILPDMKYTPAWTTYKANPVFTDGRTLQAPVSGTIARGQMPLHFEATKEDAARAGEELANPFGSDGSAESTVAPKRFASTVSAATARRDSETAQSRSEVFRRRRRC